MIDFRTLKPRSEGPTITPIVPEDELFLFDPGIFHESVFYQTPSSLTRKFVRSFRRAWDQIPEQDRDTLKEFWKPRRHTDERLPTIAINLPSAYTAGKNKAECRRGLTIAFDVFWVDWSKPKELVHMIAHELGHAISYPHGWYSQHECRTLAGETECVACECRTFSYMAAWGFDPFLESLPKGTTLADRFAKK